MYVCTYVCTYVLKTAFVELIMNGNDLPTHASNMKVAL